MIKIYKAISERLGIENLFLTGKQNVFCSLVEIDGTTWTLAIDSELDMPDALLNIKIDGHYIEIPVMPQKKQNDFYTIHIDTQSSKKKIFQELLERIRHFEDKCALWEQRKEQRYDIGLEHISAFGLYEKGQKIIIDKIPLPAFINNVSFTGINITTMIDKADICTVGKSVLVILKFLTPIEQITLDASIQMVRIKKVKNTNRFIFVILSLQVQDPPLAYKERITQYIKTMEVI